MFCIDFYNILMQTNKWASPGTIAPQVRSLRKTNNDQVAIAIDMDHSSERLEDDDDDKGNLLLENGSKSGKHRICKSCLKQLTYPKLYFSSLFNSAHGFKSLTTSKIVPRFTRPVSDMVDGLW